MFEQKISKELNIKESQVENTLILLAEGATIPFIARYRKEKTGSLDELAIANIQDLNQKYLELDKRKKVVIESIKDQGKLTKELENSILLCETIQVLEDIYIPYKHKKKTKADIARDLGLEGLAKIIMSQKDIDLIHNANRFLNSEINDIDNVLQGARDIISEWINSSIFVRKKLRYLFSRSAILKSKVIKTKVEEAEKYKDYFDFSEKLSRCASHRFLAIQRGKTDGFLRIGIDVDKENAIRIIEDIFIKSNGECADEIRKAAADSYKRLLFPSLEKEFINQAKEKADNEAIQVFSSNLEQLLLSSPLGQKRVLGVDPAYRTGCKLVCLDAQGNLLYNETIYPHPPQNKFAISAKKVAHLVETYNIQAIAIGNGTASRETERFFSNIHYDRKVQIFVVSENGASVYSASKIAREEFPNYDITVRGAVSIGRRLMDPLAELVKIDPKSIGVGQYQHDVDQNKLHTELDKVVVNCVNKVGVNLNTASKHLLTYISGLGPVLANNIVEYRQANGAFKKREDLLKVKRLGNKAYEQAVGFLRVSDSINPLENTGVHPESYSIVERMLKDLSLNISDILGNKDICDKIDPEKYINKDFGLPTIKDIIKELEKPGIDPRTVAKILKFDERIRNFEDVEIGMILPGIVTNITNFGAFVDIGTKPNGLVHISQITDRFISSPNEVLKLHQHVKVKVIDIDITRKRIQLSMKEI
ncbi:RNA-binding transcriptional accessory protein [Marinilabiliaceae bacterium JC040]|nr:RNA-binding transcriptional accessory protein [Marinilabiliaceae bacterium JC040]